MVDMEKGKRDETVNGEFPLPEPIIQHIQSFLSGKEAARTTALSKSWYKAWLTRPAIDLDEYTFSYLGIESRQAFEDHVKKTMGRYRDLNLNIESFRLWSWCNYEKRDTLFKSSIVSAMKMGASNVQLDLPSSYMLPQEVLGSETLLKLSLIGCNAVGNYYVSCSRLKSLSLRSVPRAFDVVFEDILKLCVEMEELSLSGCRGLPLNLIEMHKLKLLYLYDIDIDSTFFSDFVTRFPCLKDLTVVCCPRCTRIQIASSSLETITFEPSRSTHRAEFDIPSIQKFSYSGSGKPHLSIKTPPREWEFDITIACTRFHKTSWFLNLKKSLMKFRLSRISLSITIDCVQNVGNSDIEVVPRPLMLENLTIYAHSSIYRALLVRMLGVFRPKFVNAWLHTERDPSGSLHVLREALMQQGIPPYRGIPDQDMFGQFGLRKVNMEVYELFDNKWQPIVLEKPIDPSVDHPIEHEVRFELAWD